MDISVLALSFALALLLAGIMGYAIQRGATCTVAAVEQLLIERNPQRFIAILFAAMWVTGGLLVARLIGLSMSLPGGYAAGWPTIGGGVLLGLGAYVNRACVFGAIARLGSGEWSYLITPLGFFLGFRMAAQLTGNDSTAPLQSTEPTTLASAAILVLLSSALAWKIASTFRAWRRVGGKFHFNTSARQFGDRVWQPTAATSVIGISFVALLLLVGAWAYTDVIADLARGMQSSLPARGLLLLALFAGALLGGYRADRFRHCGFRGRTLLRCTAGGALMGAGSCLIPGGNDGLLLVGMPMLWPYAWLAFAAMLVTIAVAMRLQGSLNRRR